MLKIKNKSLLLLNALRSPICILVYCLIFTLSSCSDSEKFYDELLAIPEITTDYNAVYETGDVLELKGRLNPDKGLTITIGAAKADYKVLEKEGTMDVVSFVITPEMGTGSHSIIISSGGNTIIAPAIEIVSSEGLIDGTLLLEEHTTLGTGDVPFYCRNGKGDIYLFRSNGSLIEWIKKDGTAETVLILSGLSDEYGTYSIKTFLSGAVIMVKEEQILYFSAITPDNSADNSTNDIYRLVRYNITTGKIETLNRSLLRTDRVRNRTLETITPFEGNIKDVKIFQVGGIYPDSGGKVYLQLGNYALALLTAEDNLTYLLRNTTSGYITEAFDVWDKDLQRLYTHQELYRELPGIGLMDWSQSMVLSPDEELMYTIRVGSSTMASQAVINLYSLGSLSLAYSYAKSTFDGRTQKKYIAGPFSILTGVNYNGVQGDVDMTGFMPLPDAKLLLLYYQNAYGILDFNRKYGERYAGSIEMDEPTYSLQAGDTGLNWDEDDMIYTIANNKTKILKSRIKK